MDRRQIHSLAPLGPPQRGDPSSRSAPRRSPPEALGQALQMSSRDRWIPLMLLVHPCGPWRPCDFPVACRAGLVDRQRRASRACDPARPLRLGMNHQRSLAGLVCPPRSDPRLSPFALHSWRPAFQQPRLPGRIQPPRLQLALLELLSLRFFRTSVAEAGLREPSPRT